MSKTQQQALKENDQFQTELQVRSYCRVSHDEWRGSILFRAQPPYFRGQYDGFVEIFRSLGMEASSIRIEEKNSKVISYEMTAIVKLNQRSASVCWLFRPQKKIGSLVTLMPASPRRYIRPHVWYGSMDECFTDLFYFIQEVYLPQHPQTELRLETLI